MKTSKGLRAGFGVNAFVPIFSIIIIIMLSFEVLVRAYWGKAAGG